MAALDYRRNSSRIEILGELIAAARGEIEVDMILEGGDMVNVISGEVYRTDVAVHKGRITGFDCSSARSCVDASGMVMVPGFIDGHVHIESAMVPPPEYARVVVPKGTTAAVIDPHEIANVMGIAGVKYMLESSRDVPMDVYVMVPSCVPATFLETSGAVIGQEEISTLMGEDRVLGLAEMMNYPGVIFRDHEVLGKLAIAGDRRIDGHAPQLGGRDLSAYISAGIRSDHECTSLEESREKLRKGMYIMIREGSAAKNLLDLLPLVRAECSRSIMFVSDDRHPSDILREGHIDFMVKTAIQKGLNPVLAIQIASLNPALYFGLNERGAIAPGYAADIVLMDGLDNCSVLKVFKDGRLVAENGELMVDPTAYPVRRLADSVLLPEITADAFKIKADGELARVIGVIPDQIVTKSLSIPIKAEGGEVVSDLQKDILTIAVIERHRASGRIGLGLVRGMGLKRGAIATSVSHDSHNVAVVGTSQEEMLSAVLTIKGMGGGLAAVENNEPIARLPLPIAGLLSEKPMKEVAGEIDDVVYAARDLGSELLDPFMTLSFLALPVIPQLKITDMGLVDVLQFKHVPLFIQ